MRGCQGDIVNPQTVKREFDREKVGLWENWQGNLSSPVVVVGQDWGDVSYYIENNGWEKQGNPTNKNLVRLSNPSVSRSTLRAFPSALRTSDPRAPR